MTITWEQLSAENYAAAERLLRAGLLRSSVSRSYYAAYAAVAACLPAGSVTFPRGWRNPTHRQVRECVGMLRLQDYQRSSVRTKLRNLFEHRKIADYGPHKHLDRRIAEEMVREAYYVLTLLGIPRLESSDAEPS